MEQNRKDLASGAIFVGVGLFYGTYTLRTLPIGRALDMGPGYFPIVLSGLVTIIGVCVMVRSFFVGQETPFGVVPWRGIVMLTLAIVAFGLLLDWIGMLPAVFAATFLASMASKRFNPLKAGVVSIVAAFFCVAVFIYGIKLPIPVIIWPGQ